MTRFALGLAAALLSAAAAHAASSPYPVHIERQRGPTLVIEHTPVPARVGLRTLARTKVVRKHRLRPAKALAVRAVHRRKVVRRIVYRDSALAGGCYDGGHVRRQLPVGTLVLHRDVCEGVAPLSSLPGRI